ncbi:MAG: hypothetical protein LBN22_06845 [Clostridiales Family XIII bacterium]|nr:hypothetical protein [Clostridiales Family XIII bacterium]
MDEILLKLMKHLPDFLTGDSALLKDTYQSLHYSASPSQIDEYVTSAKLSNLKASMLILSIILIIIIHYIITLALSGDGSLDMSKTYQAGDVLDTVIEADYEDKRMELQKSLIVGEQIPDTSEEHALIAETKKRLVKMILGNNQSLSQIKDNLMLPNRDPQTGVELNWMTSDADAISADGNVNFINGQEDTDVNLDVMLSIGSSTDTVSYKATLRKPSASYDITSAIEKSVDSVVDCIASGALSKGKNGTTTLPTETADGLSLKWKQVKPTAPILEVSVMCFILVAIFFSRHKKICNEAARSRDAMLSDFPDFLSKLVLLVGAGMVVTSAFHRVVDSYIRYRDVMGRRYLYEQFVGMQDRMNSSNTSLIGEFDELAKRSCLREIMRFSSVLSDNLGKGTALVDKLERESNLLFEVKKTLIEEKGKIAETKLTGPMALELIVIMAITVAPALLDMSM